MERLKSKYEKLYQMVLKIFESERVLLQRARTLNKEVLADQKKFQRFQESQKQEKDELESLRAEMQKADAQRQGVEEQVTNCVIAALCWCGRGALVQGTNPTKWLNFAPTKGD